MRRSESPRRRRLVGGRGGGHGAGEAEVDAGADAEEQIDGAELEQEEAVGEQKNELLPASAGCGGPEEKAHDQEEREERRRAEEHDGVFAGDRKPARAGEGGQCKITMKAPPTQRSGLETMVTECLG